MLSLARRRNYQQGAFGWRVAATSSLFVLLAGLVDVVSRKRPDRIGEGAKLGFFSVALRHCANRQRQATVRYWSKATRQVFAL